jgi:HlyD family secretion protein
VLKVAKSCFSDIVAVSGIVIAREETLVLPERQGLKVSEILAEPGDTVTAGQTLIPPQTI